MQLTILILRVVTKIGKIWYDIKNDWGGRLIKRPLLFLNFFILTVYVGAYLCDQIILSSLMVLLIWAPMAFQLLKKEPFRLLYSLLVVVAVFILSLNWHEALQNGSKLAPIFGEAVVVQGTVIDTDFGYENRIILSADFISVSDENGDDKTYSVDENMEIVLVGESALDRTWVGQVIRFETVLDDLEGKRNPGGFDRRLYRRIDGIKCTGRTQVLTIEYIDVDTLYEMIWRLKQAAVAHVASAVDEDYSAYGIGMIAGEKGAMSAAQRELIQTAGLSHIFAVSGLHFGIVYLFLYALLCRLEMARSLKVGIIVFVILFYTILLWGKVSVVRAAAMLILMIIGNSIGRKYDPLSALSLISIVMLISNPLIVFSVAYQLSFAAVLTIFTFIKVAGTLCKTHDLRRRLLTLVIGGLFFQMTLQPVLAYHFNAVSNLSMLSNALTASIVGFLIPILAVIAVFGGFYPVQLVGGYMADILLSILYRYMLMVQSIPFALVGTVSPDLRVLVAYYGFLGLIVLIVNTWEIKAFKMVVINTLVMMTLCFVLTEPQAMMIYYLDVGQGDGILIETERGEHVLIDTGPQWAYYDLEKALLRLGVRDIDLLVLTHNHNDHDGNLNDLIRDFRVRNILVHDGYPLPYEIDDGETAPVKTLVAESGMFIELDAKTGLEVLYSGEGISGDDENNRSIVLEMTYYTSRYLFTGDIEREGERFMSENIKSDRYDIIKIPHHGSDTSSTDTLLNAADFDYAVVQCGNNFYGLPKEEVLLRYEAKGSQVMSTKEHGCIVVQDEKGTIKIETFIE